MRPNEPSAYPFATYERFNLHHHDSPKKDLESGRAPSDNDTIGGFIAVCVCMFMLVLLYFALAYPANQYYRVHYPGHPPPMYTMPQNYPYFYGA